ncbi:hypothetical protein BKI52_22575 [marine bacterium AO1-C]|nr:hypothetical protein BKI52_22575 [marine bacterium AO1-C]
MFRQKHISFIVGLILVLGAIFGGAGFLLIEDAENFEKREQEEKLKESSVAGAQWLGKYKSGGDNNSTSIEVCFTKLLIYPKVLTILQSPRSSFPNSPKTPLFIRYCTLKIAC